MNEELMMKARQLVADRYAHTYLKNAIIDGHWDGGELVQTAYAKLVELGNVSAGVE